MPSKVELVELGWKADEGGQMADELLRQCGMLSSGFAGMSNLKGLEFRETEGEENLSAIGLYFGKILKPIVQSFV